MVDTDLQVIRGKLCDAPKWWGNSGERKLAKSLGVKVQFIVDFRGIEHLESICGNTSWTGDRFLTVPPSNTDLSPVLYELCHWIVVLDDYLISASMGPHGRAKPTKRTPAISSSTYSSN